MKLNKIILSFISALAILLSSSATSFAKVVGDKIVLGSAISLTGKYSSNGVHTQNGYNMAVDRINCRNCINRCLISFNKNNYNCNYN